MKRWAQLWLRTKHYSLSFSFIFFLKGEKNIALCTYAYLCNLRKCVDCTFPECSNATDLRYSMFTEGTEMKLVGRANGINYYMEFLEEENKND